MSEIEFQGWGKIPRLNREMVVTEKIDGTQAAVGIKFEAFDIRDSMPDVTNAKVIDRGGFEVNGMINLAFVYAQSRNRIINPHMDNHGFANWVWDNAEDLMNTLGEGLHFGEWWGSGIQRGYGLPKGEKHFSLFNVKRWEFLDDDLVQQKDLPYIPGLGCVPVVYSGLFSTLAVTGCIESLKLTGSLAAPGFMRPEGVVVYHTAGNLMFKATIENDEVPKSLVKEEAPTARMGWPLASKYDEPYSPLDLGPHRANRSAF